jgi:hypothetical protein
MNAQQLCDMKKRQQDQEEEAPMSDEMVVSMLGQKDSRFARNGLSRKKLKPQEEVPVVNTNESSRPLFPGFGQSLGGSLDVKPPASNNPTPSVKSAPTVKPATSAESAPAKLAPSGASSSPIAIDCSPESIVDTLEVKVQARKTKLRRSTGAEMMKTKVSGGSLSPSMKGLHTLLLKETPQKSVETTIRDAIDMNLDTPATGEYIKLTHGLGGSP